MALEEYKRKRNFRKTPEPGAKVGRESKKPIFVIQEHHATRLHYDFRLEADGVLKSWAVTKEPSLDPSVKRLAVEVEDHPVAYATFSGDIPEGEYGAGHVEIWDHGTYDNIMLDKPEPTTISQGIEAGRLEFELHGEKLNGRFAMIRMKDRGSRHNWLLIKMKDEYARRDDEATSGDDAKNGASNDAARRSTSSSRRGGNAAPAPSASTARSAGASEKPELTHLDKVMFPEPGFTKGDLLDYYGRIAERILPFLADRPVTVERFPDGMAEGGPRFWQKNTPTYYPSWIPRAELPSEEGKTVNYAVVNDVNTLLYFVNQGTITFHVWQSRLESLDRPDFVIFDLDPGAREFSDVMTVARTLHALLDDEKIPSYVKTSGKSGLHVIVPWTISGDYEEAREWLIDMGERVVKELPEIATMERNKAKRKGRLYLDVMQNARGKHVVPPYVVRATPGATVSTPLQWRELTAKLTPTKFDLKTLPRRLARQSTDPFAELARLVAGGKSSRKRSR